MVLNTISLGLLGSGSKPKKPEPIPFAEFIKENINPDCERDQNLVWTLEKCFKQGGLKIEYIGQNPLVTAPSHFDYVAMVLAHMSLGRLTHVRDLVSKIDEIYARANEIDGTMRTEAISTLYVTVMAAYVSLSLDSSAEVT